MSPANKKSSLKASVKDQSGAGKLKIGEILRKEGQITTNHLEQARLQLTRKPYPRPQMTINPDVKDIFGFDYSDFKLTGYRAYPHIRAQVSV